MEVDVKYLTDKKGKRTAVQVPYEDWKHLTQENEKLKQLLKVKTESLEARPEAEDVEHKIDAVEFVKKWQGFLRESDTDQSKYAYLSDKYK